MSFDSLKASAIEEKIYHKYRNDTFLGFIYDRLFLIYTFSHRHEEEFFAKKEEKVLFDFAEKKHISQRILPKQRATENYGA